MVTARTFSGPRARAASVVTTLESMPPERPTTARLKPARRISLWMKRVRIAATSSALIERSTSRGSGFIASPFDALEFFDRQQQSFVAGQGRHQPLAAELGRVEGGHGQGLVQAAGPGRSSRPSGPTAMLPPQKHSPSSKPTRLTTTTTAPINWANDFDRFS